MAPPALPTPARATSTLSPSSTTRSDVPLNGAAAAAAGVDNTGLSQAQIGGIVGGALAAVVVVTFLWYWATHTPGYLYYHYYYQRYKHRGRPGWFRYWHTQGRFAQENENENENEAGLGVSAVEEMDEEGADADAAPPSRPRRHRHHRRRGSHSQPAMTAEQYYQTMLEAEMYAAEQAQAEEDERAQSGRPPGVAVTGEYVLNPPPPRFPPTVRPANYRQSAYPQFRK